MFNFNVISFLNITLEHGCLMQCTFDSDILLKHM